MKVLATRRYPGSAFEELSDVEVMPLAALTEPRYDRIDVTALSERAVVLTNTPGVLDSATADLTFALILAVQRRVVEGDRLVRSGQWRGSYADAVLGQELTGSTLGIIGLGRIGAAVARRARGFELRVLYTQRRRVETGLGEYRELDDLLRESDVVTIHAPRTPETEGLIDARRLALVRDGATLVNTARGEIVDEQALVRELVSGRISAGLDVFAYEPNVPIELLGLDNVVLTPHIGSATVQTREAMPRLVVDNLVALERGDPPPNVVTPA